MMLCHTAAQTKTLRQTALPMSWLNFLLLFAPFASQIFSRSLAKKTFNLRSSVITKGHIIEIKTNLILQFPVFSIYK
jgi:hypothetical protein